jgi:hypothetical protein
MVMLLVLSMLLMLAILATALSSVSLAEANSFIGAGLQTQANSAAIMGAQDAVARLRTGSVDWIDLPLCATAAACPASPAPLSITDPGGRYRATIFKRGRDAQASEGNAAPVVVISSVGNSLSSSAYQALIEVEVQMPQGNGSTFGSGTGLDY